ncbi:uncharacterized protein LOC126824289 [Patella vulgata]|uniref:uncharacterized protein LOC126824289 n=1 Tax=Patella vulgata TaxID=6465 RepID=UPI0024A825D5|nr:uncharacterized protein LOC126824289 [Patella vulgata]
MVLLKRSVVFVFIILVLGATFVVYLKQPRSIFHKTLQLSWYTVQFNKSILKKPVVELNDKWIVVSDRTASQENLDYLQNITDWMVVLVYDHSESSTLQCRKPSCVVLDQTKQKNLGYQIFESIPHGKNKNKCMGYMYAIQHGAKYIYDTDGASYPWDNLTDFLYEEKSHGLRYNTTSIFNPYRHFGQPTLWPRGYPLNSVGENITHHYFLGHWKTPLIQQTMTEGSSDVDAYIRLTRKKTESVLNVTFDRQAPPVFIAENVFSPLNAQNTLFHYKAMWALLLPISTPQLVSDIWRGYWAQRLLWEIGGTISFLPPNGRRILKPHSYFSEAVNEKDLYFQSENLINLLQKWQCGLNLGFFYCIMDLTTTMATKEFLSVDDVKLVKAWLNDLKALNYTEPKRVLKPITFPQPSKQRKIDELKPVYFWPTVQSPPSLFRNRPPEGPRWFQMKQISNLCSNFSLTLQDMVQSNLTQFPNILLIILFNYPHYGAVPYLEKLYKVHFKNILYCGDNIRAFEQVAQTLYPRRLSFIEIYSNKGYNGMRCMNYAMKMKFNVDGYLMTGDDAIINPWSLKSLPLTEIWGANRELRTLAMKISDCRFCNWWWGQYGRERFIRSLKEMEGLSKKNSDAKKTINLFLSQLKNNTRTKEAAFKGMSDVYYIPRRHKDKFIFISDIFCKHEFFLELAFPTLTAGLEPVRKIYKLSGRYIWGPTRDKYQGLYSSKKNYYHPIKIEKEVKANSSLIFQFFCKKYFPFSFEHVV